MACAGCSENAMWHRRVDQLPGSASLRWHVYKSLVAHLIQVATDEGALSKTRRDAILKIVGSANNVLAGSHPASPKYADARQVIIKCHREVAMLRRCLLDRDDAQDKTDASDRLYVLLGDTKASHPSYRARKLAGLRYARRHGQKRCKVRDAVQGKTYACHNYVGVMWIGGACVHTNRSSWKLLQITTKCALVFTWTDDHGETRRMRIERESWKSTGKPQSGLLLSVAVQETSACSVVAKDHDDLSYANVPPYHKIMYARAPCKGALVLALIRRDNVLVCYGCGAEFGTNLARLAKHVGLHGRWACMQWRTHHPTSL